MQQLYIGIDIGTTTTKAICFDATGKVIRQFDQSYQTYHLKPEWSVQKPDEVLKAVLNCIKEITKGINPQFISFSSAMQIIMAIDQMGNPITDAMTWSDNRANLLTESLKKSELGKSFYQKTGIPIHPFSAMAKLIWLKEYDKINFSNAYKFISIKEYVWHKLTGEYVVDSSMASGTGLLNIHTLEWDSDILNYLNIKESQLSTIVSPIHKSTGISDSYQYIIGGGDGALANFGTGAMETGRLALSIGTSGAVRLPVDEPFIDPEMRTQCYHLIDNQYLKLGAVNNGAIIIQWLKDSILKTEMPFEELIDQAETVPAGSDGLLFFPYLLGERAPIWDASAKGTLFGITIIHTQAHLIRSALEGILFGLFNITEILIPNPEKRKDITIMASGGFGKNEFWLQMVADIFQMKVVVAEIVEASAWGAVMIGLKSVGTEIPDKKTGKIFLPNTDSKEIYKESLQRFNKIYPVLINHLEAEL